MPSAKPLATLDDSFTCTRIPSELVELYALVRLVNSRLTNRLTCFYCGETATDEDHAIPHSLLHGIGHKRTGYETDTLPCCHECNSLLSSKVFDTLGERKGYLARRLRTIYARNLHSPTWTEEELDDLGYTLRSHAMAIHLGKQAVIRRLGHLAEAGIMSKQIEPLPSELAAAMPPSKPRRFKPMLPDAPTLVRTGNTVWFQDDSGQWDYRYEYRPKKQPIPSL